MNSHRRLSYAANEHTLGGSGSTNGSRTAIHACMCAVIASTVRLYRTALGSHVLHTQRPGILPCTLGACQLRLFVRIKLASASHAEPTVQNLNGAACVREMLCGRLPAWRQPTMGSYAELLLPSPSGGTWDTKPFVLYLVLSSCKQWLWLT
jgi:hypothetical protein